LERLHAQDYGVTIQLYRTPYLVDIIIQEDVGRVLTLDSIKAGKAWLDMDMLIFNSWHWWIHTGDLRGYVLVYNNTIYYVVPQLNVYLN
jgi:Mlc titration factor MtfA (ptsG expression regulator)